MVSNVTVKVILIWAIGPSNRQPLSSHVPLDLDISSGSRPSFSHSMKLKIMTNYCTNKYTILSLKLMNLTVLFENIIDTRIYGYEHKLNF